MNVLKAAALLAPRARRGNGAAATRRARRKVVKTPAGLARRTTAPQAPAGLALPALPVRHRRRRRNVTRFSARKRHSRKRNKPDGTTSRFRTIGPFSSSRAAKQITLILGSTKCSQRETETGNLVGRMNHHLRPRISMILPGRPSKPQATGVRTLVARITALVGSGEPSNSRCVCSINFLLCIC